MSIYKFFPPYQYSFTDKKALVIEPCIIIVFYFVDNRNMQQRQITILLLIITAVCATEINFFDAQSPIPVGADSITIYSNLIQ